MNQSYENIDWEVEAKRIATAFDVKGKCEFVEPEQGVFLLIEEDNVGFPATKDGAEIDVLYDREQRHFTITGNNGEYGEICVAWDNSLVHLPTIESGAGDIIARAFYCLRLLTPEIETALGMSISAHEKLKWSMEYEESYGEVRDR